MPDRTISELVQVMETLKNQKRELDEQLNHVKAQIAELEPFILGQMTEENVSNLSVNGRTWYAQTRTFYSIAEPVAFSSWVVQNNCPEFFQKRVAATAVKDYLESNGELPPGISSASKQVLNNRS